MTKTNSNNSSTVSSILLIVSIFFYIITLVPSFVFQDAAELRLNNYTGSGFSNVFLTYTRDGFKIEKTPHEDDWITIASCSYDNVIDTHYCGNVTEIYNGKSIKSMVNSVFSLIEFTEIFTIIIIVLQIAITILKHTKIHGISTNVILFIYDNLRVSLILINIAYFVVLLLRYSGLGNSLNHSQTGIEYICDISCIASNFGFITSSIGGICLIASCYIIIKSQLDNKSHKQYVIMV